jgi:hypothetical protein
MKDNSAAIHGSNPKGLKSNLVQKKSPTKQSKNVLQSKLTSSVKNPWSWLVGKSSPSFEFLIKDLETLKVGLAHGDNESLRFIRVARNLHHFVNVMMESFRMDFLPERVISAQFCAWIDLDRKQELTPYLKWLGPAAFSQVTDQRMPPMPKNTTSCARQQNDVSIPYGTRFGLVGRLGSFFKSILKDIQISLRRSPRNRRALCRAQTLLMLKKGFAPVSNDVVQDALREHKKILSTPMQWQHWDQPIQRGASYPQLDELAPLEEEVRRTIRELFQGRVYSPNSSPIPSVRGYFSSRVSEGGQFGALQKMVESIEVVSCSPVLRMSYHPHLGVISRYINVEHFDIDPVHVLGKGLSWIPARPSAVCEPLKVRIVTAGGAGEYYLLKNFQSFCWKVLKDHNCFSAIGRPLEKSDLDSLGPCVEGEVYVSGDYKSATDMFHPRMSWAACDEFSKVLKMPRWESRLLVKSLIGHKLDYSSIGVTGMTDQGRGQLMGSITSFIVLCVVNAALCRHSMEEGEWGLANSRLCDLPLKVNGDDCVFRTKKKTYDLWERITSTAGLTPSVGKTYVSPDWCQMNSEMWGVTEKGFEYVPYTNYGLLCRHPSKGNGSDRSAGDLPGLWHSFIRGWDVKKHSKMLSQFISHHNELLKAAPISWWLPIHLGGLALPRFDEEVSVTFEQLNLAEFLLRKLPENGGSSIVGCLVKPGASLDERSIPNALKIAMEKCLRLAVPVKDEGFVEDRCGGVEVNYPWDPYVDLSSFIWDNFKIFGIAKVKGEGLFHQFFKLLKQSKITGHGCGPAGVYLDHLLNGWKMVVPGGMNRALRPCVAKFDFFRRELTARENISNGPRFIPRPEERFWKY